MMDNSVIKEVLQHSPTDIVKLAWSFVITKVTFPKAKIIRRPIAIRKRRNIEIGSGFSTGKNCRLECFGDGKIIFGSSCQIGDSTHIASSNLVRIGNGSLIASKVFISDTSHGLYKGKGSNPSIPPAARPLVANQIIIGENVWVGDNVAILPGSIIGSGAVIGANAVVSGTIPKNTIAVGVPARPIKQFDKTTQVWTRISQGYQSS